MNPTKNLIESKPYMNPTKNLIDPKLYDGLQDSSDGMICTYCKKFPNIAGPSSFISGNKSYRIDGIRSHFSSPKHLQCSEAYFAAQRRDNERSN
jgi:Ca2+-dependent lipid-binding protein